MGVAGGQLYIVCDHQLYEVNPVTGARRRLGKPNWREVKDIVSIGDQLYIVGNGLVYRVHPDDGSRVVLGNKGNGQNDRRSLQQ